MRNSLKSFFITFNEDFLLKFYYLVLEKQSYSNYIFKWSAYVYTTYQ